MPIHRRRYFVVRGWWHSEDASIDTHRVILAQRLECRRCLLHGDRNAITTGFRCRSLKICDLRRARCTVDVPPRSQPPVGQRDALLDDGWARSTDQDRGPRLLYRFGPQPYGVEVDVLAVVFGFALCPQQLQGSETLSEDLLERRELGAMVPQLFFVPARADPEQQ